MGLFSIFKKSVIYYPGCYTRFKLEKQYELYKMILKKLGIKYVLLDEVGCCGGVLREAGYETEVRKLARKNFNKFQDRGIKKIITNCALCYGTFLNYGEMMPDWNVEVEHIHQIILEKLEADIQLIENIVNERIAYFNSCYLKDRIEAEQILELLGYDVIKIDGCCGSCGNLPMENPELANKIAQMKIKEALRLGVKRIVVADAIAFEFLKKNSDEMIEVVELGELLAEGLGIENNEEELEYG